MTTDLDRAHADAAIDAARSRGEPRGGLRRMLDRIALVTALHTPPWPRRRPTTSGLPLGVQLVGRWGRADRLLDLAAALRAGDRRFRSPIT